MNKIIADKKGIKSFAKSALLDFAPLGQTPPALRLSSVLSSLLRRSSSHGSESAYAKSAFTFAELMISLLVISILSAILYPTIAHFTPNSNKPLFKSAYRMLTTIVNEIVNENPTGTLIIDSDNDRKDDDIADSSGDKNSLDYHVAFCTRFCEKANVIHRDSNNATCAQDCADAQNNWIQTSNGMRWRFYAYDTYASPTPNNGTSNRQQCPAPNCREKTFKIFVDVNASNNGLSQQGVGAIRTNLSDGVDNTVNIDQMFVSDCTNDRKGGCGVFYFDQTKDANTGIYSSAAADDLPNYNSNPIVKEKFNPEHLKIQDTFEILIDNKGKIRGMSPAAWANLEDHTNAGN